MLYLIINREGIFDAINGDPEKRATSCSKANIFDVASSIKADEIILIWEDKSLNSQPLWVIGDIVHQETLAYIDVYVKKYTPFTAFFRAISLSTFINEIKIKRGSPVIDTDIFVGVVIAEAHLQFDHQMEKGNGLPIQAYLSTLSATIISAINSGYSIDQIPTIVKNWESTKSLLNLEDDDSRLIEFLNFWTPILSILGAKKKGGASIDDNDYLPINVQIFLSSFRKKGKITASEWKILVNGNLKLQDAYANFTGTKEDGIENFRSLYRALYDDKKLSEVEIEIILSASLSILSSGDTNYLSLALSVSKKSPLVAHWYMLFTGMHKKREVFKLAQGIGYHIKKHLEHDGSLFSKTTSDISYTELKVVLTNQINIVPFITVYNTVIDVEVYPLVKAKFRIKRNSRVVNNETREGVFLTNNEYQEITKALSVATKTLDNKTKTPKQQTLFNNNK